MTEPGQSEAGDLRLFHSGIEDRHEEFGQSITMVLRTLQNRSFYPHEVNDALVKMHFVILQFAKDRGLMPELLAHDIKTMETVNKRVGKIVEKTGDREIALMGLIDHTCHYQLVLDTRVEPGKRTWTSPFKRVLDVSRRIGQFDLTEQWIHEEWTMPRLYAYAETMGQKIRVSPWSDDGVITVELVG